MDDKRERNALGIEPESLNVGQLNQAVRDLRELLYQKQLKVQDLQAQLSEIFQIALHGDKPAIANVLFELANKLAGEETGHLAGIIHCVVSELWYRGKMTKTEEVNAFEMIDKLRLQDQIAQRLKGGF
jgi:hypothetical protein